MAACYRPDERRRRQASLLKLACARLKNPPVRCQRDEKPAETIREVSPKLKKLAEDINTYLNKKQSAGK